MTLFPGGFQEDLVLRTPGRQIVQMRIQEVCNVCFKAEVGDIDRNISKSGQNAINYDPALSSHFSRINNVWLISLFKIYKRFCKSVECILSTKQRSVAGGVVSMCEARFSDPVFGFVLIKKTPFLTGAGQWRY